MPLKVSEVPACAGCPLQKLFPNNAFVAPRIVEGSTRLQIGEAPGEEEALCGEPFVGGAGRLLDVICRKAGLQPSTLSRMNVIQCRPPGNVFPTDSQADFISKKEALDAINQCYVHHVLPVLGKDQWQRIDLLGTYALNFIAKRNEGIFKLRGTPLRVSSGGGQEVAAIATLHPAYVMRDQVMFPVVAADLAKLAEPDPEHYSLQPSLSEFSAWCEDVKTFTFDIETLPRENNKITVVALSKEPFHAVVIPFQSDYVGILRRLFLGAENIIGHNCVQFDLPVLERENIVASNAVIWDTMLMHHLVFPDFSGSTEEDVAFGASKKGKLTAAGHTLRFLGSQFCCKPSWKDAKENLELYAARDADVTFRSWLRLKALLAQFSLERVYSDVSVPLAKVCFLMHETGISYSNSRVKDIRVELESEISKWETFLPEKLRSFDINKHKREPAPTGTLSPKTGKPVKFLMAIVAKKVFPWHSNTVIADFLYRELALPPQLHIKTRKMSVNKTALYKLYRRLLTGALVCPKEPRIAEIIQVLLKLRRAATLQNSFIKDDFLVEKTTHAHFSVHGTNSGRLSSSGPNLQNQPETAKFLYIPSHPDWRFCEVDFSSIENRLTAWFANDTERLLRLTDPNFNEHKWVASQMFKVPYESIEKSNDPESYYHKAKRVGHGSNYGMGPRKIANLYDLDFVEVKDLFRKWKEAFRQTVQWQLDTSAKAKRNGFLVNPFGRKRWFWTSNWYTESLSFLPQSTAADIMLRCMIVLNYVRVNWPLEKVMQIAQVIRPLPEPCRMLVQVHDSLLFEFPPEKETELLTAVSEVLTQPWPELGNFSIPIAIKLGDAGKSWGELEVLR